MGCGPSAVTEAEIVTEKSVQGGIGWDSFMGESDTPSSIATSVESFVPAPVKTYSNAGTQTFGLCTMIVVPE